jgi:hypothetical protein
MTSTSGIPNTRHYALCKSNPSNPDVVNQVKEAQWSIPELMSYP